MKRRKPIRRVSVKRMAQLKEYYILRNDYLAEHRRCELCGIAQAQDIHHRAGRVGSKLNDVSLFLAVCRPCHDFIHNNPKQAYAMGHLIAK